jgi:hypothetical protein
MAQDPQVSDSPQVMRERAAHQLKVAIAERAVDATTIMVSA